MNFQPPDPVCSICGATEPPCNCDYERKAMMDDKELLMLAAKASGIKLGEFAFPRAATTSEGLWAPLDDDGDALRLAVKLGLTICNEHITAGVAYCEHDDIDLPIVNSGKNESEIIPNDYAATRRAIVLAAAEIGKWIC